MTEISNVKVYDLKESIIASGYPMRTDLEGEPFEDALKRGLGCLYRVYTKFTICKRIDNK